MAKDSPRRSVLPPRPLLAQYRRFTAAPPATDTSPILDAADLDAPDERLADRLRQIAESALPVSFHASVFARDTPQRNSTCIVVEKTHV